MENIYSRRNPSTNRGGGELNMKQVGKRILVTDDKTTSGITEEMLKEKDFL